MNSQQLVDATKQFCLSEVSGNLVYRLDNGPPVTVRFWQQIKLSVYIDAPLKTSNGLSNDSLPTKQGHKVDYNVTKSNSSFYDDSDESTVSCSTPESRETSPTLETYREPKVQTKPDLKSKGTEKSFKSSKLANTIHTLKTLRTKRERGRNKQALKEARKTSASLEPLKSNNQSTCATKKKSSLSEQDHSYSKTVTRCQYCQQQFETLDQFYNHRRAESGNYTCQVCGKVEAFEAHLIVHSLKHANVQPNDEEESLKTHEMEATEIGTDALLIASNKDNNSTSKLQKNEVLLKAEGGSNRGKKKKKKQKIKCSVCGLVMSSRDSLKIHTMLHTGECPYKCCVCGEKFPSLTNRQHHMDSHITINRFRCVTCNLRFPSRAEVAKHQRSHLFKCSLCDKIFPNRTCRSAHFRLAHPEDILRCNQCPALFSCADSLARHLEYHSKRCKRQCPVCGRVVFNLKEHMKSLHSVGPQAPIFVCDQCPKSYTRLLNLEKHIRTHTGERPYACSHCPKRFYSNGVLRKHLLTHTQERPYQCEICGKQFSQRSNLQAHMRIHSSSKLFTCPVCSQAFNHKNSLKGHIKSKHGSGLSASQFQPSTTSLAVPPPSQPSSTSPVPNSEDSCGTNLAT